MQVLYCLRCWAEGYHPEVYTALQSQTAVSAYFSSKQILEFGFVENYTASRVKWKAMDAAVPSSLVGQPLVSDFPKTYL